MVKVLDVYRQIRYKENDLNGTKFSDYDLLMCLKECLRQINQVIALSNSDFFVKSISINKDNSVNLLQEGVELPNDYIALIDVVDSEQESLYPESTAHLKRDGIPAYCIINNRIYCNKHEITLIYKSEINIICNKIGVDENGNELTEQIIDAPIILFDSICKITSLILNNAETDIIMQNAISSCKALIPARKYSKARTKMPFMV